MATCSLCREVFLPTATEDVYCATCRADQARLADLKEQAEQAAFERDLAMAEEQAAWHLSHNGFVWAA